MDHDLLSFGKQVVKFMPLVLGQLAVGILRGEGFEPLLLGF